MPPTLPPPPHCSAATWRDLERYTGWYACRPCPYHIDREQLEVEARLGLWRAAQEWQGKGDFATYARVRIRGAVRDAERQQHPLPRRAGDAPPSPWHTFPVSLDQPTRTGRLLGEVARCRSAWSYHEPAYREPDARRQRERRALDRPLTAQERRVLDLRAEGVSRAAIAAELGVSESRVAALGRVARRKLERLGQGVLGLEEQAR